MMNTSLVVWVREDLRDIVCREFILARFFEHANGS